MSRTPKIERADGGEDFYECDNCGEKYGFAELEDIADGWERITGGGAGVELPAGQCRQCGALCYAANS